MMRRSLGLALAVAALAVLADAVLFGAAFAQEAHQEGGHDFLSQLSIFVLAVFVGYYVVWSVTPALHTPLMAVTNAISSVSIVGALIAAGPEGFGFSKFMGFLAVILASVNIFGGFTVTHRMLQMFRRRG